MKKVTKKLSLNKVSISELNKLEMNEIEGGTGWLCAAFTFISANAAFDFLKNIDNFAAGVGKGYGEYTCVYPDCNGTMYNIAQ